ncbi:MAG: hypothetical protein M1827_000831 [Pycnora praestabilis]|nr:MAG: hypothetical protein M1827_000831 [Pycnora praestabilis]
MLAARDQENLVHGHQAIAASKPLNQGSKPLAPKTPGNKVPKTPFKVPLNDENAPRGFGGGKSVLRTNVKGNENILNGGKKGGALDKDAFVTPLGPRNRAPLGLKTTNAKAKVFQTPALPGADNAIDKTQQKSGSARTAKPRVSHVETMKIDVLGDKDEDEEREIEYMPPRSKDLPSYPDDFPPNMDYSMFEGKNLTKGWFSTYHNPIGEDGLRESERRWQEGQAKHEQAEDDMIAKAIDEMELIGYNMPEFPGDETVLSLRKKAEAEERKSKGTLKTLKTAPSTVKPLKTTKGPSTIASRNAAAALAKTKPPTTALGPKKTTVTAYKRAPSSLLNRTKKTPQPTNPSSMRHTAATAASKNTVGYSKGRRASSTLNNATALKRTPNSTLSSRSSQATLTPAMYEQKSEPPFGSDEYRHMRVFGTFGAEDDDEDIEDALKGLGAGILGPDEQALEDFQLN